jgi:hypothetical protein
MGHYSVAFTIDQYVGVRGDPDWRAERMMACSPRPLRRVNPVAPMPGHDGDPPIVVGTY